MSIKRFPVERIYAYRLFCDNCGNEMIKGNIAKLTNPPTFEYKCEKCGMFHCSKINFPFVKFRLDEMLPEEISEERMQQIVDGDSSER